MSSTVSSFGAVPHFSVELAAPDIRPWLPGNIGVPGVTQLRSRRTGPHLVVVGLLHGNEIAGGILLDEMLRAPIEPACGCLTLVFANLAAYARFDAAQPTASRFLDEDMNRVWDPAVLDGPRSSSELDRARELRPIMDSADLLLDLHSMLWPSDPLILCGPGERGRALALALGVPDLIVADRGHATGPRLIDYPRFTGPGAASACLVEAGQHWRQDTVDRAAGMRRSDAGLRRHGPRSAAALDDPALRRSHGRRHRGHQRLHLRATLSRRRRHPGAQHPHRDGRRHRNPHSA